MTTTGTRLRAEALIVKRCTACDRGFLMCEWRQLPRTGFQVGVDDADRLVPKEIRTCECGSTLSLVVDLEDVIGIACGGFDRERASAARAAIGILSAQLEFAGGMREVPQ